MRVGVSTASLFDILGVEGAFQMLSEVGLDCVDFGFDHDVPMWKVNRGEKDNIFAQSADALVEHYSAHKKAADKYGVSIHQAHAPFPSWFNGNPDANEFALSAIKKCFPILKMMDCHYLIVHPAMNITQPRALPEEEMNVNIELYSALIEDARKYDVVVCLENMFTVNRRKVWQAVCTDPHEAAMYVDRLNEIAGEKRFAFCYDTGHGLLAGHDPLIALEVMGSRVETLHVHDNDGWDDQHTQPYSGRLDWERLLEGLKKIGYKGAMTMEIGTLCSIYPAELLKDAYRLAAAEGRYFARRLTEGENA
jgi:sugar phosphate isomerase/epimerase